MAGKKWPLRKLWPESDLWAALLGTMSCVVLPTLVSTQTTVSLCLYGTRWQPWSFTRNLAVHVLGPTLLLHWHLIINIKVSTVLLHQDLFSTNMTRLLITFWLLHQFHIKHFPATSNISHFSVQRQVAKIPLNIRLGIIAPDCKKFPEFIGILSSKISTEGKNWSLKYPWIVLSCESSMRSMATSAQPCVVILGLTEFENHRNGLERKIKGSLSRKSGYPNHPTCQTAAVPGGWMGDQWEILECSCSLGKFAPFFSRTELPSLTCAHRGSNAVMSKQDDFGVSSQDRCVR